MALVALATEHPHVVVNPKILGGEPIIRGTRTPVRAIAEWWRFGASPEEIVEHLPHLTLAQVFDTLSYYQDHRREIDAAIRKNRVLVPRGARNRR